MIGSDRLWQARCVLAMWRKHHLREFYPDRGALYGIPGQVSLVIIIPLHLYQFIVVVLLYYRQFYTWNIKNYL